MNSLIRRRRLLMSGSDDGKFWIIKNGVFQIPYKLMMGTTDITNNHGSGSYFYETLKLEFSLQNGYVYFGTHRGTTTDSNVPPDTSIKITFPTLTDLVDIINEYKVGYLEGTANCEYFSMGATGAPRVSFTYGKKTSGFKGYNFNSNTFSTTSVSVVPMELTATVAAVDLASDSEFRVNFYLHRPRIISELDLREPLKTFGLKKHNSV